MSVRNSSGDKRAAGSGSEQVTASGTVGPTMSKVSAGGVCICGREFSSGCNFCKNCGSKKSEVVRLTDSQRDKVKERISNGASGSIGRSTTDGGFQGSVKRSGTVTERMHFKPSGTKQLGSLMDHPERGDHDRCDGILGWITDMTGFPFLNDPLHDVRRAFAFKVFSLIAIQFAVILGMIIVADFALPCEVDPRNEARWKFGVLGVSFVGMCINTILLRCFGSTYPYNYVLLATETFFAGIFWAMANSSLGCDKIAGQMIFILAVMIFVALPFFKILNLPDPAAEFMVVLFFSWGIGMIANAIVFNKVIPVYQGGTFIASFFTIMTLLGFFFDAGKLVMHCETDLFMRAVTAMNTDLLLVITFFFIMCLMALGMNPEMDGGGDASGWEDGDLGAGGEGGQGDFQGVGHTGPDVLPIGDGGAANIFNGDQVQEEEDMRRRQRQDMLVAAV